MEQERIQAFWGKCGLVKIKRGWKFPDGDVLIDADPQVDLNSLFRYAVPKAQEKGIAVLLCDSRSKLPFQCELYNGYATENGERLFKTAEDNDPAEALLLALDQVL